MPTRLVSLHSGRAWFSPFVDVAINGMAAMFVFLAVYVAAVPPPPPVPELKLETTALPDAVWYNGYWTALCASGGMGRYEYHIESPEVLRNVRLFLDERTGWIQGTPTPEQVSQRLKSSNIRLRVRVRDESMQEARGEVDLRIVPVAVPFDPDEHALAFVGEWDRLPEALIGRPYAFSIPLQGGIEPYEVECEGLPEGLACEHGVIEGTCQDTVLEPSRQVKGFPNAFDFPIRVTVKDQQSAFFPPGEVRQPLLEKRCTLRVIRVSPIESHAFLPLARAGRSFAGAIVASGGHGGLQWTEMGEELNRNGLTLDARDGRIVGTIPKETAAGGLVTIRFGCRISDPHGAVAPVEMSNLRIRVLPAMRFLAPD